MIERFRKPKLIVSLVLFGLGSRDSDVLAQAAFPLEETTVVELQRKLGAGEETARSLVDKYLARIAALDRGGSGLHSLIETNPEATLIADRLDAERKSGKVRGPLHGIPVVVKDNIDTADRMNTTAGSLALEGTPAGKDASIVQRLRGAGAVILAKANLSEWANIRSSHSSSGWSARGGQARNPYALDRSPVGSSSGSAVAVSANLAPLAVGTETDGSIIAPASACGIVGIKPTIGLVSRTGIIPIAHSQDTAGPMARSVSDAAVLLGALVGADPEDPATKIPEKNRAADYTKFLDPKGLEGARIGVMRAGIFGVNQHADRIAEAAIAKMKELGVVVIDPVDLRPPPAMRDDELDVLLHELKADLALYLARRGPTVKVRTLADVIAFNDAHLAEEQVYFDQSLFLEAQKKGPLTDKKYRTAVERNRRAAREAIDNAMKKHRLDALVAPSVPPAGLIDHIDGNYAFLPTPRFPAVAGYPHVTVPGGFACGLPIGISFIGGAFEEGKLIRLAFAFEQATKHRKPPRLLPTADMTGCGGK